MSVHEVTYYQAKCDGCGFVQDDYGDFSAWADAGTAVESADDWYSIVTKGGETRDLCPDCQCCEVCQARGAYEIDDHLVCDEHEDHDFGAAS